MQASSNVAKEDARDAEGQVILCKIHETEIDSYENHDTIQEDACALFDST